MVREQQEEVASARHADCCENSAAAATWQSPIAAIRVTMEDDEEAPQLVVEKGSDASCTTFTLHNEDHTIGNVLRHVLNTSPEVDFVGYSVPHPSEHKMNLRLQTVGPPATEVLERALGTVFEVGEHVLASFDQAVQQHQQQTPAPMATDRTPAPKR